MLLNFEHLKTFYSALKQKMKNFRGNWDQNDPTADDYIKNRPFYDESKTTIILPETKIEVEYAYDGIYNPFSIKLEKGKTYTVIFDGVRYESVAKEIYENEPFIGNSSILGWNDNVDTGEPFFIDVYNDEDYGYNEVTFATTIPGMHTISVDFIEGKIHKLDKKYLPDNIITTDKLDVINDYVEEAISGVENAISEDRVRLDALEETDEDIIEKLAWGSFNKNGIVRAAAGLYQTGTDTMIATWGSLLAKGVVNVNNGAAYASDSSNVLTGDLVLPKDGSITSLYSSSFNNCASLTGIVVPDSVASIGKGAFFGCSSLTEITLPFVGGSKKTSNDTYQYPLGYIFGTSSYTGSTAIIQEYYDSSTSATTSTQYYIPSSLKKVTITGGNILYGAFYHCTRLTSIEIPDSVTSIGNWAFYSCRSLKSIVIPDSVTTIGEAAFNDCISLTSVVIPNSVTSIGSRAFAFCSNLTSITIPDSVISIGSSAFINCTDLTSVEIPDSVTSIGNGAFRGCSSLMSVEIPDSVTSIENRVFDECGKLTSVKMGNSVTSIGDYAFNNCKNLTNVIIPEGVDSIGTYTFYYCSKLKSITIPDSVTSIGSQAFAWCSQLSIYCMAESQPSGWNSNWNPSNRPVTWGYTE